MAVRDEDGVVDENYFSGGGEGPPDLNGPGCFASPPEMASEGA